MAEAGAAQGKKHLGALGQTWQNTLEKAKTTAGQPSPEQPAGNDSKGDG